MNRRLTLGFGIWVLGFFLAACVSSPAPSATPVPPSRATATPTSVLNANATLAPQPTTAAPAQQLRLWLPPQFAPAPDTPGGKVLLAQIAAFEEAHTGWKVTVRLKKVNGQGGLMDSLQTALAVAPGAAPDVIALDGTMLISASALLQPLDDQLPEDELSDFYPFALQGARVNNQLFGVPFAADVIGLAYSTMVYPIPPLAWADLNPGVPLWLALNDPTALATLQQYSALGGSLTGSGGEPDIDPELLAEVLRHYQLLQIAGAFPPVSLNVDDAAKTWTAYRENRAAAAAAFASAYLADRARVAATGFTLLPTRDGNRLTFARQWSYALVAKDPAHQLVALDLIRWLITPENLGAWTSAAPILPTRSQALNAWTDSSAKAIAGEALTAALPEPPSTLLSVIGPPVTAAVQSVLNGQATPEEAASKAAEAIKQK